MDLNSTWLCRLCLQQSTDVVNICDKFQNTTIASILTQHFWFQVSNNDGFSQCLCQSCWINTKAFHVFYEAVQLVQKDYWNSLELVETEFGSDLIKQERSGTPINTELEVDLNLVKNEAIEPRALWFLSDTSEEEIFDQIEKRPKAFKENGKKQSHNAKKTKNSLKATNVVGKKVLKSEKKRKNSDSQSSNKKECEEAEDAQIREFCRMACEICGDPFETFRKAAKHYRNVHKVRGYLICCGRKYLRRGCALSHIRYHLDPDAFRCDQCGKQFTDKKLLKSHTESHEPQNLRAFKCDLCPKSFTREFKLLSHKDFVHCPVKCNECGISYPSKSKLTTHLRNIHQPKVTTTRVCDICGKDFANKYILLVHMKARHSAGENPKFQCDICGTWIKHKAKLMNHMERHWEGTAKCTICDKVLQNKFSLKSHMRFVHTEKSHRCTICDKTLRTRLSLKEHMAGHTGQDLYECAYCTKTFKSIANMYSHRKKMHLAAWTLDCQKRLRHEKTET